nr:protein DETOXIFICATION 40-like [Tanacetum cinerariifolium]
IGSLEHPISSLFVVGSLTPNEGSSGEGTAIKRMKYTTQREGLERTSKIIYQFPEAATARMSPSGYGHANFSPPEAAQELGVMQPPALDSLAVCATILGWVMMISVGCNAAASVRVSNELGAEHPKPTAFLCRDG